MHAIFCWKSDKIVLNRDGNSCINIIIIIIMNILFPFIYKYWWQCDSPDECDVLQWTG